MDWYTKWSFRELPDINDLSFSGSNASLLNGNVVSRSASICRRSMMCKFILPAVSTNSGSSSSRNTAQGEVSSFIFQYFPCLGGQCGTQRSIMQPFFRPEPPATSITKINLWWNGICLIWRFISIPAARDYMSAQRIFPVKVNGRERKIAVFTDIKCLFRIPFWDLSVVPVQYGC